MDQIPPTNEYLCWWFDYVRPLNRRHFNWEGEKKAGRACMQTERKVISDSLGLVENKLMATALTRMFNVQRKPRGFNHQYLSMWTSGKKN